MRLYAGMDASGTPDLNSDERRHNPYVVCLIAVADVEALLAGFNEIRLKYGMPLSKEFHAHELGENRLVDILKLARALKVFVAALMIDKTMSKQESDDTLPSSGVIEMGVRMQLFRQCSQTQQIVLLECDEDFQNKRQQEKFRKEITKLHRLHWSCKIKIRVTASKKSALVQLADCIAYVLGCAHREGIKTNELKEMVRQLKQEGLIFGPMAWKGN